MKTAKTASFIFFAATIALLTAAYLIYKKRKYGAASV